MAQDYLKDRHGNRLGTIRTGANGRTELLDRNGSRAGHYDASKHQTFDARGTRVGTGNLLTSLLGRR